MVTREEVLKIAKLSRLSFPEEELESLTRDLNSIIDYIDQLKEVDIEGVAPLENLNEGVTKNALRPDVSWESLSVEAALSNAPKAADNYFLVPKVLKQEVKEFVKEDIVGDEEEELF